MTVINRTRYNTEICVFKIRQCPAVFLYIGIFYHHHHIECGIRITEIHAFLTLRKSKSVVYLFDSLIQPLNVCTFPKDRCQERLVFNIAIFSYCLTYHSLSEHISSHSVYPKPSYVTSPFVLYFNAIHKIFCKFS